MMKVSVPFWRWRPLRRRRRPLKYAESAFVLVSVCMTYRTENTICGRCGDGGVGGWWVVGGWVGGGGGGPFNFFVVGFVVAPGIQSE